MTCDGDEEGTIADPEAAVVAWGQRCREGGWVADDAFSCVVKSQKRKSNKIYKTELTKVRYKIK